MMSDWAELKRLAEAARIEGPVKTGADCDYAAAAHPENILALIAGYEKLRAELAALKAMQADAVRFRFAFTDPLSIIHIELEALRGELKSIDWYRERIDIALQAKP